MEIGISLPSAIPGVDRERMLAWARCAERRGFSTLAAGDRLLYSNHEPLVALAAAAAVTRRIRLMTDVLIVPVRLNAALLAKQAATLDALSEGRLVLGVGLGGRTDDYQASGMPTSGRGKRFDEMVAEMKRIWAGEERGYTGAIGPRPARRGGPLLLFGGIGDVAARRVARLGDGWAMGEGTPEDFKQMSEAVKAAWSKAGRSGSPRLIGLCYFALGDDAGATATSYVRDYYSWLGDPPAIVLNVAVTPETARRYHDVFADAGADELVFFPCSSDPGEVDRLADVVL